MGDKLCPPPPPPTFNLSPSPVRFDAARHRGGNLWGTGAEAMGSLARKSTSGVRFDSRCRRVLLEHSPIGTYKSHETWREVSRDEVFRTFRAVTVLSAAVSLAVSVSVSLSLSLFLCLCLAISTSTKLTTLYKNPSFSPLCPPLSSCYTPPPLPPPPRIRKYRTQSFQTFCLLRLVSFLNLIQSCISTSTAHSNISSSTTHSNTSSSTTHSNI